MNSELVELSYRQIGSGNRVQIVITQSTVTVNGQGGFKRAKFTRTENTPPSLWDQLTEQVGKFAPGEIQLLAEPETDAKPISKVRAFVTIQTTDSTEKSKAFFDWNPPDQLQPLLKTIFSAQSPLEEIVYSENGMSEHLILKIRRGLTDVDSNQATLDGERHVEVVVTPADYWESLIAAIQDVPIGTLKDMEPPSNRRSTDQSLYAQLKIKFDGDWHESKSFDDDNPPEPLRRLLHLIKIASTGTFKYIPPGP